ncbi:MAG: PP0621 family protein [Janthinobacterium lividum]
MKYLLWFVIGALVFYWVTRNNRLANRARIRAAEQAEARAGNHAGAAAGSRHVHGSPGSAAEVEDMLQCAQCGMHVPASEAVIAAAGQAYCSTAHRQLHAPR